MTTFGQLVIYTTGLILVSVEAQPNALFKLFKIGNPHSVLVKEPHHYEPHVQFGPDTVDRTLSVCFALVTAYIGYIITSFFIQPKWKQTTVDLSKNPGLKALLESHHFRDNGMPVKMRNLFDTADRFTDNSYIGNKDDCVPVHSTPMKSANNVQQL